MAPELPVQPAPRVEPPRTREEYEKLFPDWVKTFPDGNYGPSSQPTPPSVPKVPDNNPSNQTTYSSPSPPSPRIVSNSTIKQRLLRPALTSNFQCWFNPPTQQLRRYYLDGGETVSFLCHEASLPGSSLMTNEITDDFPGITERHAYRRQYDDRADFTFFVDHGRPEGNYNLILLFEEWIRYCANETSIGVDPAYYYKVRFPEEYQTNIYLNKFERDLNGDYLQYNFLQAYPISISSMPVSYESSQLLKCNVSFSYVRYIVNKYKNRVTKYDISRAANAGASAIQSGLEELGTSIGRDLARSLLSTNQSNSLF